MALNFIDLAFPKLPATSVEGRQNKTNLMIPVIMDLSALHQGREKQTQFTLAPGIVAGDLRQICNTTMEQLGHDPATVELQWRDGIVWMPLTNLENTNAERLRTKWMLKTSAEAHREWPRIKGIEKVAQGGLREHHLNRGAGKLPDREVSAWPSFLSSYTGAVDKTEDRAALNLKGHAGAPIEAGMPLPKGLASKRGRTHAATLLAVTKGHTLHIRTVPRPGHEQAFAGPPAAVFNPGTLSQTRVGSLRDPYGNFSRSNAPAPQGSTSLVLTRTPPAAATSNYKAAELR